MADGLIHVSPFHRRDRSLAVEELPEDPGPDVVGLVTCVGPVLGDGAPRPGDLAEPQPPALLVLHPPSETMPSTPEVVGAASGDHPDLAVLATLSAA